MLLSRTRRRPRDRLIEEVLAARAPDRWQPRNPVLTELRRSRRFEHRGQVYRADHTIATATGELMGHLIVSHQLQRAVEVGTLFGYSTLHLAEAMSTTGGAVDTIDKRPDEITWSDGSTIVNVHEVVERLVAESGYTDVVDFVVGDSNVCLAELALMGRRYQLALIDGSHRYPVALLDFVAIDAMLDVGGYVVLDDVGYGQARKELNLGGPGRLLGHVLSTARFDIVPLSGNIVICQKLSEPG